MATCGMSILTILKKYNPTTLIYHHDIRMKSFLQYVAQDLISRFGENLSHVAVVFPNKRAALFLSDELAHFSKRPIWSPAYITISELFRRHSSRQVADPIKLVCDLHRCFTEQTGLDETLDHFYGWGQLLLSDFDDVDKHMADADKVFANLRNIHELDDVSYLTDEQRQILQKFFSNFSDTHNTELKQRFLRLWSRMGDIYHAFNSLLAQQQLAYEGALYREVAEQKDLPFEYEHYVLVGFNMLQEVEQRIFSILQQRGMATFYWDFDHYYMPKRKNRMQDNEAGHYIAQYLAHFPNAFDNTKTDIYNNFSTPRNIRYISASTENSQARFIATWLKEQHSENDSDHTCFERIDAGRRTAIVLCNESLLQTVIHCLPNEVEQVNITTGFPLIQSPAASLVTLLLTLQTTGYSHQRQTFRLTQVLAVLNHPYAKFITEQFAQLKNTLRNQHLYYPTSTDLHQDEGTQLIFTHYDDHKQLLTWLCQIMQLVARNVELKSAPLADPLAQESLFRMYTLLNRLKALVACGDLKVDIVTLQRLISQLVSSTSVPFHGEPAEGLQVMGVLETRNLDFDHVLILSCNEGNMPKGVNDTSFIPYSIRKAYGLTTIDHKVSIYSYYFHRLLQRAKDVTILYNNATTDGRTCEMSRFMLQLMVESPHRFSFNTLQAGQNNVPVNPQAIEKSSVIMQRLMKRFDPTQNPDVNTPLLTPTAINSYMRCQLQFFYNYVCGLRQNIDNEDDTIDNRIFGNIFHEASQTIYEQLTQKSRQIVKHDIEQLLKSGVEIEMAVDRALQKELFGNANIHNLSNHLNGLQLINRQVIIHYLRQLLQIDSRLTPFTIIGLECLTKTTIETPHITTTIGGRIDRLDRITEINPITGLKEERIRVVDYKTGGSKNDKSLANVQAIFDAQELVKHSDYYLQTFIYSIIVRTSSQFNAGNLPVSPALLFIQHAGKDNYDPILRFGRERIDDVENTREEFSRLLSDTIDQLFNPDIPFTPTADRQQCTRCPYFQICNSNRKKSINNETSIAVS